MTPTPRQKAGKKPYAARAYAVGPLHGFEPVSRRCPECGMELCADFFRDGRICSVCLYEHKRQAERTRSQHG